MKVLKNFKYIDNLFAGNMVFLFFSNGLCAGKADKKLQKVFSKKKKVFSKFSKIQLLILSPSLYFVSIYCCKSSFSSMAQINKK